MCACGWVGLSRSERRKKIAAYPYGLRGGRDNINLPHLGRSRIPTYCVMRSFGWWRMGPRACLARTGNWLRWRYALGSKPAGVGAPPPWPGPL